MSSWTPGQALAERAFTARHDLFGPIALHSPSDWIISHLGLPKTLKSFSVIFTERALLQGSRLFTYSALVRLANTLGLVWFCNGAVAMDSLPCPSHSKRAVCIIIFGIYVPTVEVW